jgi:acyl-CoA thioesterase-1
MTLRTLALAASLLLCLTLANFTLALSAEPSVQNKSLTVSAASSESLSKIPSILVLGDSLSAGYGIDIKQGWVSLLQKRLQARHYNYHVVNASISGETTSGGLRRLPAALKQWTPAIVIVELGGNDGLRGTPLNLIKKNLSEIVELNQQYAAKTLLLGMQIPPNYGPRYTKQFFANYADIAAEFSDSDQDNVNNKGSSVKSNAEIALLPFFLDGIATDPNKMQADGIHPKANAQAQMLDLLWPVLEPLLK